MFGSKAKSSTSCKDGDVRKGGQAFLGAGMTFEGETTFHEDMRLDGMVRGKIAAKELLVVGNTGDIQAEVSAGSLIISGRLQGNIKATKSVELRFPAQVDAEIEAPTITIEAGVIFNGSIKMTCRTNTAG